MLSDVNVRVVIVNYRTPRLVIDCLRTLGTEHDAIPRLHVVVTDNRSDDDSVELIRTAIAENGWTHWVTLLPLDRNGGFAFGNNQAIRCSGSPGNESPAYIYLLNPDTLVRPGAIRSLVAFLEGRPEVGIAGAAMEDADGVLHSSAHRFMTPLGEFEHEAKTGAISRLLRRHVAAFPYSSQPHACDWVSGATLMIRRAVLDQIGLMDEEYFLYFEEVDLCYRAKTAGWSCWFVPDARIVHLEGSATGIRRAHRRAPYWYASRRRYFVKCYGLAGLIAADFWWCAGRMIHLARRVIPGRKRGSSNDPAWFAFDLLAGDIRALMSGPLTPRAEGDRSR